jgi:peptidoglycan/LPS O-acetylase OafA/YrhL
MTPSDMGKVRRYEGVQVLRALAVGLVIMTHLKYAGDFSHVAWIRSHAGGAGVDIFFVISGFVISASAESLGFSGARFVENRITRVAPLYWLTSIPLLVSMLKGGRPVSHGSLIDSFLFLPLADFGGLSRYINPMGWSLSFELWFYLLFTIALAAARQHAWRAVLAVLLASSLLVGLFYQGNWLFPRFAASPLTWEFGAGILIYKLRDRIHPFVVVLAVIGTVVLAVLGWIAGEVRDPFGDFIADYGAAVRRAATWGLLGVCLVVLVVHRDRKPGVRWPGPLLRLGDYSYSLYLIQPYGLWIATKLMSRTQLPAWATGLSFVASTLLLGVLMSVTLEGRLTAWARRAIRWGRGERGARSASRAMASAAPGVQVVEHSVPAASDRA